MQRDTSNLRERLVQATQMSEMLRNRLEVIESVRRVDVDCQTDDVAIASPVVGVPKPKRKLKAAQSA